MTMRLEPCPFCGADGVSQIKAHYIRDGQSLGCTQCGASVRAYNPNAGDKCIELWNRRDGEMATLRYCEREWQKEREAFFDMIRDKVIAAYIDGATAVHECWDKAVAENPFGPPDFTEAAHDYYASIKDSTA